jgi:hypothetical protein
MNRGTHNDELAGLLIELFDADELRRFLEKLDGGADLLVALPEAGVSRIAFAHEVVRLLQRRGEIDLSLFEALENERPKQDALIRRLADRLFVPPSQVALSGQKLRDRPRLTRPTLRARTLALASGLLGLAIVLAGGLGFAIRSETPAWRVEACKIRCEDCPGLTRAWIIVDDGETTMVAVNGHEITFDCLKEGTKLAVILQIRDGQTAMRYVHTEVVASHATVKMPLVDFVEGVPNGFEPEDAVRRWDKEKKYRTAHGAKSIASSTANEPSTDDGLVKSAADLEPGIITLGEKALIAEEVPAVDETMTVDKPLPAKRSESLVRKTDINCALNYQNVAVYVERRLWKYVFRTISGSRCWEKDPRGLELRMTALRELERFEACIELGKGSTDKKIVSAVQWCERRLELKKEYDEKLRRIIEEENEKLSERAPGEPKLNPPAIRDFREAPELGVVTQHH